MAYAFKDKLPEIKEIPAEKLRVVFISDAVAGRNGVGSYYTDLIDNLRGSVGHAELLSPGGDGRDYSHALAFPLPGDPTQPVCLPRVSRVLDRMKKASPHVIVIPTPGPYGMLGFFFARRAGIPVCAGYHTRYEKLAEIYWKSLPGALGSFYIKRLNRVMFRSSEMVAANSSEMAAEAERDGARRVKMTGTPVARPFLDRPSAPLPESLRSVCYAGRLAPEKNIEKILHAAGELPHIKFKIAGDGPLRREVARHAGSARNIEYEGWLSRDSVLEAIDSSDMLILPSEVESFGTIALEAMARSRLVLVSCSCGILNWPELAPAVYAMGKNESPAQAISRISAEPAAEMRQKAATAHKAALSFNKKTIRRWTEILLELSEEKHGPL